MMKLDHSPSHSWWWDSHHSPKHSRWLQSNLKGLDEKVKAMLNLIEEDADSFAQRAEMYYKKRPELVNLVEEFYRAFRSLAERYDHLTGEIRQNIPKALQVQYGLSCDSPRGSPFGRQHHSPYRRDPQGFERLLQKFGTARSEDQMQSDDSEVMELSSGELRRENSLSQEEGLTSSSDSEVDNSTEVAKVEQAHQSLEEENKKLADRCSINEAENRMLQTRMKEMEAYLVKLQQEKNEWVDKWQISLEEKTTLEDRLKESGYDLSGLQVENVRLAKEASTQVMHSKSLEELCVLLKEEKTFLKEESSEGSEKEIKLRKEVELLQIEGANLRAVVLNRENQIRTLEEEMQLLQSEKQRLTSDLSAALEQGKISTTAFRFMKGEVSSLVQRNKKLRGEIMDRSDDAILKVKEEELSNLLDENKTLKSELQTSLVAEERGQADLNNKIKELHGKLAFLEEENLKQKLLILDRAEEKREAIRQLSFSIDVLKEKNQRLEGALCSAKVRLHGLRNPTSSNYVPKWKRLLMGVWNGRKTQPYALAL